MRHRHDITGQRAKGMGVLVLLALCLGSTAPGDTWDGGHGFGDHGFSGRGFGGVHRFHRFGGPRVFISPRVVVPFGPFWAPH
jgi:hypothetical protein